MPGNILDLGRFYKHSEWSDLTFNHLAEIKYIKLITLYVKELITV